MADPQSFITQYGPIAAKVGKALNVDPSIILGQFGLETGWGKSTIPGTNNLGNIKDFSGGGVSATDNMTGSTDNYRAFNTPDGFADYYTDLIKRKYPGAVGAGNDPVKFATALKAGGYAEDPDYVKKIAATTQTVRSQPGFMEKLGDFLVPTAQAGEVPQASSEQSKITPWKDVIARPDYQALSDDQKAQAQLQYFNEVVRPQVPEGDIDAARDEFFNQYPVHPVQEPSLLDSVGRQVGLTARGAAEGIAALPEMLWNGPAGVINQYAGTHIPKADITPALDYLGLPKPNRPTERVVQNVVGAMAPTGGIAKAADVVASRAVTPAVRAMADLLKAEPVMQIGSAGLGAGAGAVAQENGASPLTSTVVSLLGGVAPALSSASLAAALRRGLRGGEAGRQNMLSNITAFNESGTAPTVGQATQGRIPQLVESLLSRTPGGAGVMNRKATTQADQISGTVDDIVNRLSQNAGPVEAGESVVSGLQNFKAGVKNLQDQLYDTLDKYLPAQTPVRVDRTKAALAALNSDIEGAPALSAMFKNGRIQGIEHALTSDLDMSGGTLPYQAIKKLRTLVGNEIDNANFTSDVPRDKWRALYAALSDDLGDAAVKAGPQAQQAWQWANQFTHGQMGRLDSLSGVIGKDSPEKVFQAAMSGTPEGDTVLKRVVSAIPKQNRKDLAATVLHRMGRATPGNQNDLGDEFSISTFLTNWNKLSPRAKATLFGRIGDEKILDELGNLARVASNIRDGSKVFSNPSGTSGALTGQLLGGGALISAMTGHVPAMAAAAAIPATSYALAKALTSPAVVKSLASPTVLARGLRGGLLGSIPINSR
jgi:hypothetical protein